MGTPEKDCNAEGKYVPKRMQEDREPFQGRPDYDLMEGNYAQATDVVYDFPVPQEREDAYLDAWMKFEEDILPLRARSALTGEVVLPDDLRIEEERVATAVSALHAWLKVFQDLPDRPKPLDILREMEQILRFRLDGLKRSHAPEP